jgi:hypothetical protein
MMFPKSSVADPNCSLSADPDPIFRFDVDPETDSGHVPHQSDANWRPLVYRPSTVPFLASSFDTDADPDPASPNDAILDPDPQHLQKIEDRR